MYFLERKEPYTTPNILGGHSMPVHTWRWRQVAVCERREPLDEEIKQMKNKNNYRIIGNISEEN